MSEKELSSSITFGDKYGPAMEITEPQEAKEYFEKCVQHTMSHGHSHEESIRIEKGNLGYWAGYYGHETRRRVEQLYACCHPVFGSIEKNGPPTPEEALSIGVKMGEKLQR